MLRLIPEGDARRLRDFFTQANYTDTGLWEAFGTAAPPMGRAGHLARLLYLTGEPSALNILTRWFLLGRGVEAGAACEAVPGWVLEVLGGCGLLGLEGGEYAPQALLVPFKGMLVASDLYSEDHPPQRDVVLGMSPTARHLLDFTVRRQSRATLDLGTGCGLQALFAAGHSGIVTASDVNPRATEFAAFNARLNGLDNVECVTGDAFAPVTGRRFELIVSNPPFILAPCREYLYRDSGMELDHFCRRLAREAGEYLEEGGYFQMICEWVQLRDEPVMERLNGWFEGTGCDVWVLNAYQNEPSKYAQTRVAEFRIGSERDEATRYEEWMRFLEAKGIELIHGGLIAMRRRSGRNWIRFGKLEKPDQELSGEAVLQGFANRDFLESTSEEELLAARPRLAPDVRLEEHFEQEDGCWQTTSVLVRQMGCWRGAYTVDGPVADLLARCDGQHSLAELLSSLAERVGIDAGEARPAYVELVRRMIDRAVLIPE